MLIGAHVRATGGPVRALQRGEEIGAEVVQIFTQSPRVWKPNQYAPDVLDEYRRYQATTPTVAATYCHATYLINLATPDAELLGRSRDCLVANLVAATGMGAEGVVLHIGSHRGSGLERALPQVVEALQDVLDSVEDPCPILLENAAGAGDTVGRSFEELAAVIDLAGGDERLGMCMDTQHLWASGVDYTTIAAADDVVELLQSTVGLERLACLHLNDSKVGFGANRDRHENLGEGTIGEKGLAALLGHPALQDAPAILEVPGAGDGPRAEDVTTAKRLVAEGIAARA